MKKNSIFFSILWIIIILLLFINFLSKEIINTNTNNNTINIDNTEDININNTETIKEDRNIKPNLPEWIDTIEESINYLINQEL